MQLGVTSRKTQAAKKLIFMYKSVNGLVPTYISDLIPPSVGEISTYTLRNQNDITVPFFRTEISRKSYIPSSISVWNSLDIELRNSPSMESFKYQLKKHQNNSNNCSTLLSDLYINHLSPSPTCSCSEEVEDAEHYFFRCSNFRKRNTFSIYQGFPSIKHQYSFVWG